MVNVSQSVIFLLLSSECAITACNISTIEMFEEDFAHVFCVHNTDKHSTFPISFVYFLMNLENYGFDKMLPIAGCIVYSHSGFGLLV